MQTKSNGHHRCQRNETTCWYQCMLELHNKNNGSVYPDCTCSRNALSYTPIALPVWCYSLSGRNCVWYRDCLEKHYPCKGQDNSYAIDFSEKFCKLYEQQFTKFNQTGLLWIDAVRKCIQVNFSPVLRIFAHNTCQEIKTIAFDSHSKCYRYPGQEKPSICDLSAGEWWQVFWTLKGAVMQAATTSFKQMLDVIQTCGTNILTDFRDFGMALIQMKIEEVKNSRQDILEKTSEVASKMLSEGMGWMRKGILHIGYPTNSYPYTDTFFINVLIASSREYDLNYENAPKVNITDAAIEAAKAIEKGDTQIDVGHGMNFTKLSICVDYNCKDSSLQITPAPPKTKTSAGPSTTAQVTAVIISTATTLLILSVRMQNY
ncbi:uncharacterized protein LOC128546540 [Mercenaria mercenaria]|uniref:uncharacterized protein LOC128546540 n=1 Tax=Mercenaria mercenaria TaxID=6596 RepID=UPI00234F3042|nr:uncharacterized protein LOC128546540 [Mercenaria mercenaria]